MTQFGAQPERDRTELTQAEREAFALLAGEYGPYVDPDTDVRANIEVVGEVEAEKFLDGTPVPAGYGQANLEEVKAALASARAEEGKQIIDSHRAWLELGDEMTASIEKAQRDTKRMALLCLVLGLLAGLAIGFGAASILQAVMA